MINYYMKKKNIFLLFQLFFLVFIFLFQFNLVFANYGLDETAGRVDPFKPQITSDTDQIEFLQTRTGEIIGLVLSFIGVLFLILLIYAGLSWMTSGGSPEKVKKARDLMINATIGLVIVLSAYAIVAFIGDYLTST